MIDSRDWQVRLGPLLSSLLEGDLDEKQREELDEILRAEPESRQYYARYMFIHAALSWKKVEPIALRAAQAPPSGKPVADTVQPVRSVQADDDPPVTASQPTRSSTRQLGETAAPAAGWNRLARTFAQQPLTLAIMLMVMIFGGVVLWRWSTFSSPPKVTEEIARPSERENNLLLGVAGGPTQYVANITGGSQVEWGDPNSQPSPNARLLAGQVLEFRSGLLEVTFRNGAVVLLEGPALFSLGDGQSTALVRGKLTADVPESASGFTVATPAVEIVDLGTRFGVDVSNGVTQTSVFKGEIKAQPLNQNGGGQFLRLTEGEGARFVAAGGPVVRTPALAERFVSQLPNRVQSVAVADPAVASRNLIRPKSVRSNIVGTIHPLARMIDGSGLVGKGPELTRLHHGNELPDDDQARLLDDNANWKAVITFLPIDLEFDLGETFDLARLHVWNYAHPAPGFVAELRDARHVALWLSSDGVDFQPAGSIELKSSAAAPESAQSFPLAGRARYVRLRLTSSYGAGRGSEVGLGEVRLEGKPAVKKSDGDKTQQ